MFTRENSIEPDDGAVKWRRPDPAPSDDVPIRAATRAEEARFQPPQEAQTDKFAERHQLYSADTRKERVYYSDYQQKSEVLRASEQKITTKFEDQKTISAVLDLAEMKGWNRIKIHGTDEFKRELWVQAHVRGVETEGYQPTNTDRQEAEKRQAKSDADKPSHWQTRVDEGAKILAERPKVDVQEHVQERAA